MCLTLWPFVSEQASIGQTHTHTHTLAISLIPWSAELANPRTPTERVLKLSWCFCSSLSSSLNLYVVLLCSKHFWTLLKLVGRALSSRWAESLSYLSKNTLKVTLKDFQSPWRAVSLSVSLFVALADLQPWMGVLTQTSCLILFRAAARGNLESFWISRDQTAFLTEGKDLAFE